jgi:acetyl esterase
MARDLELHLCCQALIYPATSFYLNSVSQDKYANGYLLTNSAQQWYHRQYLRNESDRDDWRASPILAKNFQGLAPALIMTCGYDPLLDEGKEYADKLKQAGVNVNYRCYEGQIHGFITMGRVIDEANHAIKEIAGYVARAFK